MTHPTADSPDTETIRRAIAGEVEAFGELYDRYVDAMYRFIRFQVNGEEDAEDLTETVFLRAFEGLPGFRTGRRMTNFRAWIYRIARNLVIDHYRAQKPALPLDLAAQLHRPHSRHLHREDLLDGVLDLDLVRVPGDLEHVLVAQLAHDGALLGDEGADRIPDLVRSRIDDPEHELLRRQCRVKRRRVRCRRGRGWRK